MAASAQATPKPVEETKVLTLEERLKEKAKNAKETANRIKLIVSYDKDMDELTFSCSGKAMLEACKPSKSGESEGVMVDLSGVFAYDIGDGTIVDVVLSHARGGGAWLAQRIQDHK